MAGHRHGDYWPNPDVVRRACAFLGWIPHTQLAEAALPVSEPPRERMLAERELTDHDGGSLYGGW